MLVNERGKFLSQRTHPQMALIQVHPDADDFVVTAPNQPRLSLPAAISSDSTRRVIVWRDELTVALAPVEISDWFSVAMGIPCQLVYMNKPYCRPLKSGYGRPEDDLSFADGAPVMMISAESLADLNCRLERPVEMKRFRPNVVVTAGSAFAEDRWRRIRIGEVEFEVAWSCTRCTIPTVDPASGELDAQGEPLATLGSFRRSRSRITLGQNLIPRRLGSVRVGDSVEIVESLEDEERDASHASTQGETS